MSRVELDYALKPSREVVFHEVRHNSKRSTFGGIGSCLLPSLRLRTRILVFETIFLVLELHRTDTSIETNDRLTYVGVVLLSQGPEDLKNEFEIIAFENGDCEEGRRRRRLFVSSCTCQPSDMIDRRNSLDALRDLFELFVQVGPCGILRSILLACRASYNRIINMAAMEHLNWLFVWRIIWWDDGLV